MTLKPFYEIKHNLFSIIAVCRRKDNQDFHEKEEIEILLLGDKEHLNNDTGCSHEEEECIQSIEIDKDKTNQGKK